MKHRFQGETAGMKSVVLEDLGKVYCQSRGYTRFAYHEIFHNREYAQGGISLEPGSVIFDVGANIGLFSLFASRECASNATIFAFEPIPETYELLKRNLGRLESSQPTTRVQLFNRGLTRRGAPTRATFAYFPSTSSLSTMKEAEIDEILKGIKAENVLRSLKTSSPLLYYLSFAFLPVRNHLIMGIRRWRLKRRPVECELTTLSRVLQDHAVPRVDLLKIDVEGAEMEVLAGIAEEDWAKVRQLVVEVHDLDGRLRTLLALLRDRGFRADSVLQHWSRDTVPATHMVYATR